MPGEVILGPGRQVKIGEPPMPAVRVVPPAPVPVSTGPPVLLPGTVNGARVWSAFGPPTVVPGAEAGDLYLDAATGLLYQLD